MTDTILLALEGDRATITLNRPERHNALDGGDLALFERHLETVMATPGLRCLVLSGGTARSFCSGVSITDIAAGGVREGPLERLAERLERVPLPVVAALNGGVFGGAVELVLAADFRIGVEGMRVFVPPARLGLHYAPSGLRRMVERLGLNVTKRLILSVEEFAGPALVEAGLVDRLVPRDGLEPAVAALVDRLCSLAPLAVQGMKQSLNEIVRGSLDPAIAAERIARCWASADHQEGLRAFAAKRPPQFTGR